MSDPNSPASSPRPGASGPPPIRPSQAIPPAVPPPAPTPARTSAQATAFGPVPTAQPSYPATQPFATTQPYPAQEANPAQQQYPQRPHYAAYPASPQRDPVAIASEYAKSFGGEALLALRRILKSSFYVVHATDAERKKLSAAKMPVTSPLAQDFAGWRRTTLWLVVALLALAWIIGIFTAEWVGEHEFASTQNILAVNGLFAALLLAQACAIALLVFAALCWFDIRLTRRFARFAWFLQFFSPFVIFAFPLRSILDLPPMESAMFSFGLAIFAMTELLPRVVGLFPGLVRASLTLKTLLPEASAPGWVTAALCPMYALLFAVLTVVASQAGISWMITFGMFCVTVAPLLCVLRAKRLMMPMAPLDAHTLVSSLRRQMFVLVLSAIVLICWWIFTAEFIKLGFWVVVKLITGVLANVFLLTVVSADLLIGLIREAFEQNKAFVGSPMHAQLDEKFDELEAVGFTSVEGGERELAGHIGGFLSSATRASKQWLSANAGDISASPPYVPPTGTPPPTHAAPAARVQPPPPPPPPPMA